MWGYRQFPPYALPPGRSSHCGYPDRSFGVGFTPCSNSSAITRTLLFSPLECNRIPSQGADSLQSSTASWLRCPFAPSPGRKMRLLQSTSTHNVCVIFRSAKARSNERQRPAAFHPGTFRRPATAGPPLRSTIAPYTTVRKQDALPYLGLVPTCG